MKLSHRLLATCFLSPAVQSMTINGDTAVVGVGVLGKHLCRMILEDTASSITSSTTSSVLVMGVTRTSNNHETIRADIVGDQIDDDRFHLVTSDDGATTSSKWRRRFANVVFCAPPSGFVDYPLAVQAAIDQLWTGPEKGVFVFTSSGAVYDPTAGDKKDQGVGVVNEASKLYDASESPRVDRLVRAERACLEAGGCCLRLAGLYDLERGAHNFWLTSGKDVQSSPDGMINLLHYEDAAAACLAALRAGPSICRSRAFLISDGHPMSRFAICRSALKAKAYQGYVIPTFAGDEQPWALGKIYDGTISNKLLNWKPRYESFDAFMEANA